MGDPVDPRPDQGADFTRKPVLSGERVRLVPATPEHVPALYPLLSDPEMSRLTGSVHSGDADAGLPWSVEQLAEIYGNWSRSDDRIVWVIEELASGRIVGESALTDLDPGNRSCSFRIWIAGALDRGLGSETVRLALEHAFEDQQLHRVGLEVYAFNPRARHVYEKAGFVLEGTLREALLFDGTWVDAHVMGILSSEWRPHSER